MVCNLIHVEKRSWVKWIDVLIVREPVLHRAGEDVPVNLLEFVIREDFSGPKLVLAATAQQAKFPRTPAPPVPSSSPVLPIDA